MKELKYVLEMYKKVKVVLDSWDGEDINQRIKDIESELTLLTGVKNG